MNDCGLVSGVELKIKGYIVCTPSIYNGNSDKIVSVVNPDEMYQLPKTK